MPATPRPGVGLGRAAGLLGRNGVAVIAVDIPTVLTTVRIDSCPDNYEQTSPTSIDRDPGSLRATLSGSKTGISTTGVLL